MKIIKNTLFIWITIFCLVQCRGPEYLPLAKNVNTFTYGSYMVLEGKGDKYLDIEGEFIALDNGIFYILEKGNENEGKHMKTVPLSEIENFELQYAKTSNYTAATVGGILGSLSHGFLAVFTLPANIIVSIVVNEGGKNSFTYKNKDIPLNKIQMFSRFPQGLPEGIDISLIK